VLVVVPVLSHWDYDFVVVVESRLDAWSRAHQPKRVHKAAKKKKKKKNKKGGPATPPQKHYDSRYRPLH
jgi:hypothetical protein